MKFDREPVYGDNDTYIKIKTKIYRHHVNTNFHGGKVPEEKAPYKSLSLTMLYSVIKSKKKYYSQTLLEKWKCEPKKTLEKAINDDLEKSSSDESDNCSDDETESGDEKDNGEPDE